MPIRFRCVYCEKLLGIARRKAGSVVNCPHCNEKLIVPTPEGGDETEAPQDDVPGTEEEPKLGAQLFERSDFEELLSPEPTFRSGDDEAPPAPSRPNPGSVPPQMPQPQSRPPQPAPPQPMPPRPVAPGPPPETRPGVFIPSGKVTLLSVLAVVALALAFGGGLLVGRMMR